MESLKVISQKTAEVSDRGASLLGVTFCSVRHVLHLGEWGILYTTTFLTGSSGLYPGALLLSETKLQFTFLPLQKETLLFSPPFICKASSMVYTVPQSGKILNISTHMWRDKHLLISLECVTFFNLSRNAFNLFLGVHD